MSDIGTNRILQEIYQRVCTDYYTNGKDVRKGYKVSVERRVLTTCHYSALPSLVDHVEVLRLILERCRQCHISLNINKCIFKTPFGILLGHIVCKQGLLVDPSKIAIIVDLQPPTSVKQLRTVLGHTSYYRKFIKGYAQITAPMEKLLKKDC